MITKFINEAESEVNKIIKELSSGFIVCQRCGDQEETKDLDVMADLINLQELIKLIGDCS